MAAREGTSTPSPQSNAGVDETASPRPVQFLLFWDDAAPAPPAVGELKDLPFAIAAEQWLETRVRLKTSTVGYYRQYFKSLRPFFGQIPLREITIADLREYQRRRGERRAEIDPKMRRIRQLGAGPKKINQELACLSQVLKRAGLWRDLADLYEPLPVPYCEAPRALTGEEQDRLFRTAATRTEWECVSWIVLLGIHTTLSGCEMRGLHLGDVNLVERMLYVRRDYAKRPGRVRTIPLVDAAHWAAERLVERAHSLGATQPHHYLFPFRVSRGFYDPTRPASSAWITRAWRAMRHAAGLDWLRIHDLRVSGITRLAESGAPDQTIMGIAGHVSKNMLEHYSRIRISAKREALENAASAQRRPPQAAEGAGQRAVRRG